MLGLLGRGIGISQANACSAACHDWLAQTFFGTSETTFCPDRKIPSPYLQALLEVTVGNSVPGKVSLVTARVVSN
jgi:hypothetical protein